MRTPRVKSLARGGFRGSPPRARRRPGPRLLAARESGITPACVGKTGRGRGSRRRRLDHPHVRGEDGATSTKVYRSYGSPPRAWGRRGRQVLHAPLRGITPTCVGKTASRSVRVTRCSDHPHVRGEDPLPAPTPRTRRGSPPRAWGRLTHGEVEDLSDRITPTCVGKTARQRRAGAPGPDHPHVRGEDV